ncbi:solute carrier family 35 member F2-like isoform X3 [Stigmatopora argus]
MSGRWQPADASQMPPDADPGRSEVSRPGPWRRRLETLALGQVLAALVCGTAVSSQYLSSGLGVDAPLLQSVLHYGLLAVSYTPAMFCRTGPDGVYQMGRRRWLQYFLLGLVDVEANYAVVKAYQYTTLTSVQVGVASRFSRTPVAIFFLQLLDCFVIPVAMLLSRWLLKTRYRPAHYAAVGVGLLGVGAMVGADLLAGRDQGSASDALLGDGLVLVSATLYAVSNVWQEYTVKNRSRLEFLGMLGLYGAVISSVQMLVLELRQVSAIRWSWPVAALLGAFASCMLGLYSLMPLVVKESGAAAANLSMLSADVFAVFCGIFLFGYQVSTWCRCC